MTRRTRILPVLLGLGLAAFGAATMNYAKPCTLAGNTAWATRHALPVPSRAMRLGGAGGLAAGLLVAALGGCVRRGTL